MAEELDEEAKARKKAALRQSLENYLKRPIGDQTEYWRKEYEAAGLPWHTDKVPPPEPAPEPAVNYIRYTKQTKCKLCGNLFSARGCWILGHKVWATICNPCADRLEASKDNPPASKQPPPAGGLPYKDD